MPELLIDGIVSSSESLSGFEAENLLANKYKPWKGNQGSDNSVVIRISREERISTISIGNEFSAFVDVLVGNSCDDPPQFSALLPSHSFMDATESRKEVNGERVKIFTEDEMNASVARKKWNLLKIVCKQPFNNNIPFGLRFIKIFGSRDEDDKANHSNDNRNMAKHGADSCFEVLGKRLLSQDVSNKQKDEKQMIAKQQYLERMKLSCDKIREARELKRKNANDTEPCDISYDYGTNGVLDRSVLLPTTSILLNNKGSHSIPSAQSTPKRKQVASSSPATSVNRSSCVASSSKQSEDVSIDITPTIPKPTVSETRKLKNNGSREASIPEQPLSGVRFSLSGYENPRRSVIRDRAVSLGAMYLKDVDSTITHLVTAFKHTPKGKQCGNHVFILPAEWIERCFHEKRRVNETLMRY